MPIIIAFLLMLAAALPAPVSAQTTRESVRRASDKAHKDLAREAGEFGEEEEAAPEQPLRPAPVVVPDQPKPVVKPAPAFVPAPREDPAPAPAAPRKAEIPVTIFWHMADDADVYLNGRPLREYSPSFKTRGDEAPRPAFSAPALLGDGDVFTVGGRRGGSYGLMLIALDVSGRIVFMTDKDSWKAYKPGERADWFEPAAARASPSGPVTVQPDPWYPQKELNGKHGNKALSIWSTPADTFAYLYATVSLPGAAKAAEGISLRSHNYPKHLVRARDSLVVLSEDGKGEAAFKKVAGLADPSAVSFESAGSPGRFLRHQGGQLKLHQDGGDELFKKDATFKEVPGLADAAAASFESFNYPGLFIRHRDFHLYIEKGSDDLFRKDATFSLEDAPAR